MSTRIPRRIDRLYFLLRREPTVRMAENLEIRHSFSLYISKTQATARNSSFCTFSPFFCLRRQLFMFFVLFIKHFYNSICVPFFLIFDTWHNLGHPSHPLSTHTTCFRWVHIVCDFCRITCLSRAVLRYPMPRKTLNSDCLGIQ